jgi:alginate O-acetyltransferase complex protein AlgI
MFFALWPWFKQRQPLRWSFLVIASFIFYGWWDWRFLVVLIVNGLLNYSVALLLGKTQRGRTAVLAAAIVANIGWLAAFKYSSFLAQNFEALSAVVGVQFQVRERLPGLLRALPIGISFYTFSGISYLIDVYRGQVAPARNVLHFFSYLALFPKILAGPIERSGRLLPQLAAEPAPDPDRQFQGLQLIVHGFFKKLVIADNLAPAVRAAFDQHGAADNGLYWWTIAVMFTLQIYCDFSGYTDIARGLARWMGLDFALNFDHPYISTSLREFWKRWHISLSSWFRDYVYIPLGGSASSRWRYHANMWVTMVASGLWHGAAWNFVVWGAWHALLLSVERLTKWPERLKKIPGGRAAALALTFVQVCVGWVFFRAGSLEQAAGIIREMFSVSHWSLQLPPDRTLFFTAGLMAPVIMVRELYFFAGWNNRMGSIARWRGVLDPLALALMFVACIYLRGPGSAFIYFQF